MIIEKIKLNNFRCYESFQTTLHPNLTVFVGDNGSGKTAILDALAIALSTFTLQFDGKQGIKIAADDARLCYYDMGDVLDSQGQFPVEIAACGDVADTSLTWTRTLLSKGGKTRISQARDMTLLSKAYAQRVQEGSHIALPLISYYGTGRLFAQKKEKKDQQSLQKFSRNLGYLDCLSSASNEKVMLKWFEKMTLQEGQSGRASVMYSAVRYAVSQCFAQITGAQNVRAQFNLDTHQIEMIYTDTYGLRNRMPLNMLSDGYKTTISMIADIAYRMAVLNPWMGAEVLANTPGVVLIDEVDLHLHPNWQQRILGDLQSIFPQVQFIVTTHAPAVIASAKRENLRLLSKHETFLPSQEVYGGSANVILQDVMCAEERPVVIKEKFQEIYTAIDKENFPQAQALLDALSHEIGSNDPDVISVQVTLDLEDF